jgi:uncharacterized protein with HEPN domain
MDNNIKTWLYDILSSINEIESYFIDKPKEFKVYENDVRTKKSHREGILKSLAKQ